MRNGLVGAASLIALMAAAGVSRADQPARTTTSTSESVSEVIVTAEKREEKVQDVPLTMTVVPSAQLDRQNIQTTSDLVRAVPALTEDNTGVYQIRSIGTQGFGRSAEQSVSVVLDGVVLARTLTNAMYDIDNVEVLEGPQGTLFGKNASSGVISIVTHAPVLGQFQAIGHLDVGDHDYTHGYVIANIPLGDTAALRLSYHHDSTGHIVYNTLYHLWDHNTDDGGRARLLWQPNDRLTINISGDVQQLASNGVNGVADFAGVQVYTSVPAGSPLAATLAACGVVPSPSNNRVCGNSLYAAGVRTGSTYGRWNAGGSVQVDYDLWRGYTFTSITAVRQTVNEDFHVDGNIAGEFGDTLPQNILDRNLVPYYDRVVSEEARIASPAADPINFVAGVYYSSTFSHDKIDQTGGLGLVPPPLQFRRLINIFIQQGNEAVFGQANWRVTPQLTLLLGGRLTHDDVSDFSFNSFPNAFPAGNFIYTGNTGFFSVVPINSCTIAGGSPDVPGTCPAGTGPNQPGRLKKTGWSGKVGAQYFVNHDVMVFATVARGYKGPFANESVSPTAPFTHQPLVVNSEYPTDVELGVKATALGGRLAIDASLFTDKIDSFQTTIFVPPGPNQAVANFIQGNAPHAITRGAEVTVFGNVSSDFTINGGLIYDDSHFSSGFEVSCGAAPCLALRQLPLAPHWKATVTGDYHHSLTGQLDGFAQSDLAYSSSYPYGSAPGFPGSPPRYQLGARLGVRSHNDRWSVAVFCRNCLDKRYPIFAEPDGFSALDGGVGANGQVATEQFLSIDSYRVVGLTLDGRF